jgi:hypothetical protein
VYQKIEENDKVFYEYMSDSLDSKFEDYLTENKVRVGEPAKIILDE